MSRSRVKNRLLCFLLFPAVLGLQSVIQFSFYWFLWEPWRGLVPAPEDPSLTINMIDEMWFAFGYAIVLAVVALILLFYIIRSWRSQ